MTFNQTAQDKAFELAALFAEELQSHDDAIFTYEREPEAIESKARSGFIPFTSGGAMICHCASIDYARGTGAAPGPIQSIIDSGEELMADEWARQYPDRPSIWDCIHGYDNSEIPADWRGDAEQWDSEWFSSSDDCYYYKARVMFLDASDRGNETGAPEVYVDCYLVTDSYGRDHIGWLSCYGANPDQTRGTYKRTIPLTEFLAMGGDEFASIVNAAIAELP